MLKWSVTDRKLTFTGKDLKHKKQPVICYLSLSCLAAQKALRGSQRLCPRALAFSVPPFEISIPAIVSSGLDKFALL